MNQKIVKLSGNLFTNSLSSYSEERINEPLFIAHFIYCPLQCITFYITFSLIVLLNFYSYCVADGIIGLGKLGHQFTTTGSTDPGDRLFFYLYCASHRIVGLGELGHQFTTTGSTDPGDR